ncbi:MAG: ribonuclease H-like domain-containing protein [Chitinophagaceae bacterium]|nr:ribonuclease H-like domain-containing protein [Chitinophagaceae bacterium]
MTNEQLKPILFIDIETVTMTASYEQLSKPMQDLWQKKAKNIKKENEQDLDAAALYTNKGGIFSEFSKVVCIGIGSLVFIENEWVFRLTSIADNDEKVLLNKFSDVLQRFESNYKDLKFCGHNIKEFDLPFICRRFIINQIPLPNALKIQNKKPWEIHHQDTLELWKFGDYKNYTSLTLLAEILGIPSPKDDIDGSMVGKVYWEQGDLKRIATYCMQDVLTSAKVFLRLSESAAFDYKIVYVENKY